MIHSLLYHSEAALGLLLKTSSHVTPVILKFENDMSEHEKECRSIIIDLNLPAFDEEKNRVGIWWYQLTRRYLTSCKGSLALLSIFHGPRVELLFNMIGNILDKQSGRMNIDTYSAILTVKYNVFDNGASRNGVKSISFKRADKLHTPISNLRYNMRNARRRYKGRLKGLAKENKEKRSSLVTVKQNQLTKKDLEKKNAHRNKLAKSDLTLRNSVTSASKVTIAAKASNSQMSRIQATPQVSQTLATPQFLQAQAALLLVLFLQEKLRKNHVQPL